MNYMNQSVKTFFYGSLVCTPQGNVVVLFTLMYWLYAALVGLFGVRSPMGWEVGKTVVFCMSWPLILFLYFVKDNQPSFQPSLPAAGLLAFYGVAPVFYVKFFT